MITDDASLMTVEGISSFLTHPGRAMWLSTQFQLELNGTTWFYVHTQGGYLPVRDVLILYDLYQLTNRHCIRTQQVGCFNKASTHIARYLFDIDNNISPDIATRSALSSTGAELTRGQRFSDSFLLPRFLITATLKSPVLLDGKRLWLLLAWKERAMNGNAVV